MHLRYIEGVTTLTYDEEKCVGCGLCTKVCPMEVLQMHEKKATVVDKNACIECGACAKNCPVEAFSVRTGAGCAAYVINTLLGGDGDCCGCGVDDEGRDIDCC